MQLQEVNKMEDSILTVLQGLQKDESILATCKKEIDMECGGFEVDEVVLITKMFSGIYVVSKIEHLKRSTSFAIMEKEIPTYFKI